ncbi:unnamed protein product [Gordionus sp. m RMFG-2023]
MSDYVESEAELSLDEDELIHPQIIDKNLLNDEDDSEEEEGEDLDKDLEDLIDDNEDIVDNHSDLSSTDGENLEHKKRKKKKNISDAELEEEDYELIEENLGIKVKRKKFRRIRMDSGDESTGHHSDNEKGAKKSDSRKIIAEQLFQENSDDEQNPKETSPNHPKTFSRKNGNRNISRDEEFGIDEADLAEADDSEIDVDEDDMADFIVDDAAERRRTMDGGRRRNQAGQDKRRGGGKSLNHKKYGAGGFNDDTLQQAQDVFGCDFDFGDFPGGKIEEEELEDDLEEGADGYDSAEEFDGSDLDQHDSNQRGRRKRTQRKKDVVTSTSPASRSRLLQTLYEPAELEARHLTARDAAIRASDVPERFLTRSGGVRRTAADANELESEADWIFERAFSCGPLSIQEIPMGVNSVPNEDPMNNLDYDERNNPTNQPSSLLANSDQEFYKYCQVGLDINYQPKPVTAIAKIREVLNFFRNQSLEVPFVAHYRKECYEPELNLSDLWKIYHWDERWVGLRDKKNNLLASMEQIMSFLEEVKYTSSVVNPSQPMNHASLLSITYEDLPIITDIDLIKVKAAQTIEEVEDYRHWFALYFGPLIEHIKKLSLNKQKRTTKDNEQESLNIFESLDTDANKDKDISDDIEDIILEKDGSRVTEHVLKKSKKRDFYSTCLRMGLGRVVTSHFGIAAWQFGENLRDNYQKHEVTQTNLELTKAFSAETLLTTHSEMIIKKEKEEDMTENNNEMREIQVFLARMAQSSDTDVDIGLSEEDKLTSRLIIAARRIIATRIAADPSVRRSVRTAFFERAKISVHPAPALLSSIASLTSGPESETDPLYGCRYLKGKPVRDLIGDQFLRMAWGRTQGYISIDLGMTEEDHSSFFEELRPLIEKDEFGINARSWNEQRSLALNECLTKFLYPIFSQELGMKLLRESADSVLNSYAFKLYSALKVGPYKIEGPLLDEHPDEGPNAGRYHANEVRVLGLAYSLNKINGVEVGGVATVVDRDGALTATLRLPNILKNKRSNFSARDRTLKESELAKLRTFLGEHRPHVIAVGTCESSRLCLTLREELKDICLDLEQTLENFPPVAVVLVEEDLANIVQQKISPKENIPNKSAATMAASQSKDLSSDSILKHSTNSSLLKKSASLARRVQDPLLEFAQLFPDSSPSANCMQSNDIFCLKLEPLQELLTDFTNVRAFSNNDYVTPQNEGSNATEIARKRLENLAFTTTSPTTTSDNSLFASDLHRAAVRCFVDRINETGVDLNRLLIRAQARTSSELSEGLTPRDWANSIVQFVSGLGPRKGAELVKTLEKRQQSLKSAAGLHQGISYSGSGPIAALQNRTQLVTMCSMGPKVFVNCAGFIKIDTTALSAAEEEGRNAGSDYYVEILDSTRIHPETYEWARKMAVDALEYDEDEEENEEAEEENEEDEEEYERKKGKTGKKNKKATKPRGPLDPASALEEIFECPDKLKDLDLDAFAEELTRQGFGNKTATLYDIRSELTNRYKDTRIPPMEPTLEERFNMVTKETPQTFYIGKLLSVRVLGLAYVNPKKALERLSGNYDGGNNDNFDVSRNFNPVRNEETGLWTCPICYKADFGELSEVWQHFDCQYCPGQPVGIK